MFLEYDLVVNKKWKLAFFQVERDSLNSYDVEDDYGEYEEDEDEIFEEIDYGDSPVQEALNVSPNKKCVLMRSHL